MQWPAVFLPCLRKNRFPSQAAWAGSASATSSRTPRSTTPTATAARSRTRRGSFYVAVTRAQKYLFVTFSPVPGNQQHGQRSEFFDHCAAQQWLSTRDPACRPTRHG